MSFYSRRTFLKHSGLIFTGLALKEKSMFLTDYSETGSASLEEKIGQMFMIGFRGLTIDKSSPIVQDIFLRHIGSVVLFDYDVPNKSPIRNISSPRQLKKLISDLQSFSRTPLLIALDYEGGRVSRLKEKYDFPATYSAQYFGQSNNPDLTFRHAEPMAKLLKSLGINLNLAPVVDLNTNPDNPVIGKLERSYSKDSEVVTSHAEKFIQAFHGHNVLCTLKHFPGHGSSTSDSHLGMVDVSSTWNEVELLPYKQLILKGKADAIMTAHVFNQHLDSKYPATLSKKIITGLLREILNYNGVVIADDMQMGAIAEEYGLESAIFRAVDAGVDILPFANNSTFDVGIAAKAVEILDELIKTKKISLNRIDESFRRIMNLKSKINFDKKN
ncbi:glycoside hydrolase family 3 protein [Acidobacteriota bacterium]